MVTRCAFCHRPLKDPRSIDLGIGPECRTKTLRRLTANVDKAHSFYARKVIAFKTKSYHHTKKGWTMNDEKFFTDGEMLTWLSQYNLIDIPTLKKLEAKYARP